MKKLIFKTIFIFLLFQGNSQTPPPITNEDYLGTFIFPNGSVVPEVEVLIVDSILMMNSVAGSSEISKVGVDSFFIMQFEGIAVFHRDDAGKVDGVHIEAGGYILDGTKKKPNEGSVAAIFRQQGIFSGKIDQNL